uniref:DUF7806 domain-containing protein n=1 Tax=Leersia perrieri TaxID=77586 RepID=A0A0D9UZJ4_9ORYZ
MEQLNTKLYAKYTALKKRKLLDEGLDQKREADIREFHQAMKDLVGEHEIQIETLSSELTQKEQQLVESQKIILDQTLKINKLDSEILRLQCLLAEKNDASHHAATPDTTTEMITENQTPLSRANGTPKSNSKRKSMRSTEKTTASHGSFLEEARELDCCRRHGDNSGSGTEESSSIRAFNMLAELLGGMKISMKNETEGFSFSFSHEASGYSFTLTWADQPDGGEWLYQHSSLGTLERIAMGWMKQDIIFSTAMFPVFFQRISRILRQG